MSTFKVTVEKLRIHPHPNADALELAEVGLYRAVVGKGQFQDGDYALYIPEQAVLPADLIEELGLVGRLAGPMKDRVKAIRLRGELSQGIVCRPREFSDLWEGPALNAAKATAESGYDCAEKLEITKWVPPIPVGMAGEVEAAPEMMKWIEVENIKRYPTMFGEGDYVVATEKIHGTCCLLTYQAASDEVWVTSKGLGSRNLALKASDTNLYWRAVRQYRVAELARELCRSVGADKVGIFGEVYGAGVQDLNYGATATADNTLGYAIFDIAVETGGKRYFLDADVAGMAVTHMPDPTLNIIPWVPVLYRGPYDYETLAGLASGQETVSGESLHLREGLVVRPRMERRSEETGGRAIAKFVSPEYLIRNGGTEFE